MSFADRPVQHQLVEVLHRHGSLEQPLPYPGFAPPAEPLAHRVTLAELVRQIRPRQAGPQQVAHTLHEAAIALIMAVLPNPADGL